MEKEILKIEDGLDSLSVQATSDCVTVWIENIRSMNGFDLNQEETLMLVVGLLDALKTTWPVYGELEDMINKAVEEIEAEELVTCPQCYEVMEPLSGGGSCNATNMWRCNTGGHGVWFECAKCGSTDPKHTEAK